MVRDRRVRFGVRMMRRMLSEVWGSRVGERRTWICGICVSLSLFSLLAILSQSEILSGYFLERKEMGN